MKPIECFIHHHLGLGDHIICNGIVRYVVKAYAFNSVSLVVKKSNLNNVKRMFSDLPQVSFFVVEEDKEFIEEYNSNLKSTPLLRVGFERCRNHEFDRSFYESVNVPFKERWDSWCLERDIEQEQRLISELNLDGEYIFVHDKSSVGNYNLNINSGLRQVKPDRLKSEKSIFDWMGVIENAKEIHGISSSFTHLIDSMKLKNKLYFHDIKASHGMGFSLKNNWEVVSYG
mgnify:CR=1 FL=1|tara:strand:- start:6671 stop:7357 length:687 start_codon:yes stop_codon:yes gene_type:complete